MSVKSPRTSCKPDRLVKALVELEGIGTEHEAQQKIKRRSGAKVA